MKLSELYKEFRRDRKGEGRRESTLKTYDVVIRDMFIDYMKDIDIEDMQLNMVKGYVWGMQEQDRYSPNTIVSYVRMIKTFLKWLYINEYIEKDISIRMPKVKGIKRHKQILDDDEILSIFNHIQGNTERDWRKRAMFALMFDCGLRSSEITTLQLEDVDLDRRQVLIRGERAKGWADRAVRFSVATRRILERYLRKRRTPYATDNLEIFFVNEIGTEMSTRAIRQVIELNCKNIGIKRCHAHLIRHTCITRWCLQSSDMFYVQQKAGHQDLSTTRGYFHIGSSYSDAKDEYSEISELLSRLKLPNVRGMNKK